VTRFPKIGGKLLRWQRCLCGAILLLVMALGGAFTFKQTRKDRDREFVASHLLPLVHYVEVFRDSHERLPTTQEFEQWAQRTYDNKALWYYPEKPDFISDWGTQRRDFVVGAWRGEWVQYYRSWDHKTFEGDVH
jgi:hypothetical protein